MQFSDFIGGDSYVLDISVKPYIFELYMDFCLSETHSEYRRPEAGGRCFRRGKITIHEFSRVSWIATKIRPSVDANNEIDYGLLDKMEIGDELYIFEGDWGVIEVRGGDSVIVLID